MPFRTLPNKLTLLRMALIPVYIGVFYLPVPWARFACVVIFTVAAITDWLDGYLARRLGQFTSFGAFLDPVADKLMVAAALILLLEADPTPALAIPVVVIVGREIAISALREWMAGLGSGTQVAVTYIGKVKTTIQMISIILLIYHEPLWGLPIYTIGFVLLYVAAILTLWSMFLYLNASWPSINGGSEPKSSAQESAEVEKGTTKEQAPVLTEESRRLQ